MVKKLKFSSNDLNEKLLFINTVHTALLSSIDIDDIYKIILSSLVSRNGLNFSRAFLFVFDNKKSQFVGLYALGPNDELELKEKLQKEKKEQQYLEKIEKEILRYFTKSSTNPSVKFSLAKLKTASQWIYSYQDEIENCKLTSMIRDITIPLDDNKENIFYQVIAQSSPILFRNIKSPIVVDPRLMDIIEKKEFITFPLKTKSSILAAIIVDNKFNGKKLGKAILEDLEWFGGEIVLALENAQLYSNLQHAYNQLQEVDRLKSNFLSLISHELRTPLTSIIGYTDVLINGKIGKVMKEQKKFLTKIMTHSIHLQTMVSEMLELIELEIKKENIFNIQKASLTQLLKEVTQDIEVLTENKNYRFTFWEPSEEYCIYVDKDKFKKALYYILDNAFKFTNEDNGIIRLDSFVNSNFAHINITDNGIGIPKNLLSKIFDKFYQVDSDLNRSYGGLGIGLTLASNYITKMKGYISVHSQVGKGSKFTVSVPLYK